MIFAIVTCFLELDFYLQEAYLEVLQSHEIENDHSDEDKQPTPQETHIEPVVNPAALFPLAK